MIHFLKFTIVIWVTLGVFVPLVVGPFLDSQTKITGTILAGLGLIVILFIAAWPKSDATLKRSSEIHRFWRKPWWQCAIFGTVVFLPAYMLNLYVQSFMNDGSVQLLSGLLESLAISILFGLFMHWRAKR
ncbi:MAG: hypothetical protein AAGK66_06530, partial [Pseudomonadota bacterium]